MKLRTVLYETEAETKTSYCETKTKKILTSLPASVLQY